jgi:hypothetical protein
MTDDGHAKVEDDLTQGANFEDCVPTLFKVVTFRSRGRESAG